MSRWRGNPWAVLLTLSLGFFMTLLDLTAVNVAIPSMMGSLHASLDEVLWVINIYILVLAALLIMFGRLGDVRGPRAMFIGGVALFTVASVLCGLSQDPAQLIAARAVQGLGAAALMPQTMTIIIGTFPAERRGVALGVWGAVAGVATIAGPTLGGLLVSTAGWRWIFFVNVPIGAVVLLMTVRLVPDIRQGNRRKLDVVGVVLAAMTLVCLTFALTEGQRYDWGVGIWALLGGAAMLLVLFLIHQRARQHDEPLLPFVLFRDRDYAVMSFVAATVQVGMLGLFLPVMIYLQSVLHFSALTAGLVMAPAMVVSAVLSPVSGRMADRIGGKYVLMTGLTLFAGGMAWLTWVTDVGRAWWEFQPALIMSGVGIGCVFGPMVTVAMYNVEPAMAGAASGVLNTIRQVGTVFGSAAVGAVLQNRLAVSLQDEAAERAAGLPADVRGPFLAGFRDAARSGQEAGAGQDGAAIQLPPGTPTGLARHIEQAAASTYEHGVVHAMRPTLALPIVVIAVGAVSCFLVRRRQSTSPRTSPEPADLGAPA
ncbi:DHA2 family efflux MFS transporter permease subunit [Streptomyces laculatispora]|uniref:DHA2 family efflux MFS transporter permease subunit n=1 Tax=Streptomyces laculatispora TaxID=887464 RepID=UPI001A9448D1|nr:DHA2 family efflux MFS transporter permease subunit [Streptomyces laculatispora]MBO0919146.1 DHA2 family efflux MFS transporter permease subunit [Streptomyces laculatispora]